MVARPTETVIISSSSSLADKFDTLGLENNDTTSQLLQGCDGLNRKQQHKSQVEHMAGITPTPMPCLRAHRRPKPDTEHRTVPPIWLFYAQAEVLGFPRDCADLVWLRMTDTQCAPWRQRSTETGTPTIGGP